MTLTSGDTESPRKSYENLNASFRCTLLVDFFQPQLGLSTRRIFTKKKEMMACGKHVKLQGELRAPLRFKWLTLFWAQELPKFHAPWRCWALKEERTPILWHNNHTNFDLVMVEMCVFLFRVSNQKSLCTTSKLLLSTSKISTDSERTWWTTSILVSYVKAAFFVFSALPKHCRPCPWPAWLMPGCHVSPWVENGI